MIDFLSSWAEQIIIAIIISSIIEMILPDNKNKKYIKMVIGIYVLFTIISPIINKKDLFNINNFDIESFTAKETNSNIKKIEAVNQKSMDERLEELYIEELENNIKSKVMQEGYNVISCKVDAILNGDAENQEIKNINLVVSKIANKEDIIESKDSNSNIKNINKIEINVGLNKLLGNNKDNEEAQTTNIDIQRLKEVLSSYYEIDIKKINISIK